MGCDPACGGLCPPLPECFEDGDCAGDLICVRGTCVADDGDGPPRPIPACRDMPPLHCDAGARGCGELIQFEPAEGLGYTDFPENGETWDDQYRSWLRRDLVLIVQYAAAYTDCMLGAWQYGNGGPVGLIDMSERNGAIPGASVGNPGHPGGTHTNGYDIDVSYYQVGTPDNSARPVCDHISGGRDAYHCVGPPDLLDPWRTAMFIAALNESPHIRIVGVDGRIGPLVEEALNTLCEQGWLSVAACGRVNLAYEVRDGGLGWYRFHHHHFHVSMSQPAYGKPGVSPSGPRGPECLVPGCPDVGAALRPGSTL